MIEIPRYVAHLHAEVITGEGVVLSSPFAFFVLKGRVFELVAPLIDGHRSVDELVDALKNCAAPAEVYFALQQMEQRGYIRETARPEV